MTNAELIAALNRLDELFSDESKWTQGEWARDVYGNKVPDFHPTAVCWCLVGGAHKVKTSLVTVHGMVTALAETIGRHNDTPTNWNDAPSRTFADVKRLIADTRTRLEAA